MTKKSGVHKAQPYSETSAEPGISTSTERTAEAWPTLEVIEVIPTPRRRSAAASQRQRLQSTGALLADAAGDLKPKLSASDLKQVKRRIPKSRGNSELPVAEDGAAAEQPAPDAERSRGLLRGLAAASRSKLNSSLAQIAVGSAPMITKGQQVAGRISARVATFADLASLPKRSIVKGAFRDLQGFVQRIVIDEPLAVGSKAAGWVDSHDPKGRFAAVTSRITAWHEERAPTASGDVPADGLVTDAAGTSTVEVSPRRRARGTKPTGALKPATKKTRPSPEVQPDAQASAAKKKASGSGSKAKPAAARKKKPQISSEESVDSSTPVKRARARTPGKATKDAAGQTSESLTASASGAAPELETDTQQAANTAFAPVSESTASPADAQTLRSTIEDEAAPPSNTLPAAVADPETMIHAAVFGAE